MDTYTMPSLGLSSASSLALFLLVCSADTTLAQSCDSILTSSLFNESEVVNRTAAASAVRQNACSSSFNEMQSSGGFDAGVSYGIFSADGSASESNFSAWQQENCSEQDRSSENNAFHFSAQRSLAEGVVDAWRACMTEQVGLSCFFEPGPSEMIGSFVIVWNYPSPNLPTVRHSFIGNGTVAGTGQARLFDRGDTVFSGEDRIPVERTETSENVVVSLSIVHEDFRANSCSAVMPAVVGEASGSQQPLWAQEIQRMHDEFDAKLARFTVNETAHPECPGLLGRMRLVQDGLTQRRVVALALADTNGVASTQHQAEMENMAAQMRVIETLYEEGRQIGCVRL